MDKRLVFLVAFLSPFYNVLLDSNAILKDIAKKEISFQKVDCQIKILLCHLSFTAELKAKLDFDFIVWGGHNSKEDTENDLFMSSPTKYDLSDRHDEKPRCVKIIEIGQGDTRIETNVKTINLNNSRKLVVQVKFIIKIWAGYWEPARTILIGQERRPIEMAELKKFKIFCWF